MAQEKMSGMEMMLNSLLKAAGFDPTELRNGVEEFATGLQATMQNANKRLSIIDARLERIEIALAISREKEETDAPAKFPLGGPNSQ